MKTMAVATPRIPSGFEPRQGKPKLVFGEILRFAYETFCSDKVRFLLTALGMVIGTASLILVATIGLTGKQYILGQIQGIGANMIYADYEGGGTWANSANNDYLTLADMNAVDAEVPGVRASSPMFQLEDRITAPGGRERDVTVLGVSPGYEEIRNLWVLAGRFFDDEDTQARSKVGLLTDQLAQKLYGSQDAAVGREIKISGLPFTIVGTFKERVETFGQSEITSDTVLIPYTVAQILTGKNEVKQLFFTMADLSEVEPATDQIHQVLQSRHRSQSVYRVQNLTQLLQVAGKTANALTLVLLLISLVTLLVSGVGIMNIMLATVSSRIREIGIRKAMGATNAEIKFQFLSEAVFISLAGGIVGILIGLAVPFSLRFLTSFRIPISGLSVFIAVGVASAVGIIFGTVPAARAAQLDPVESLRYE